MKFTSLKIEPAHNWKPVDASNPLVAVVRVQSETSTVETRLPESAANQLLAVCRQIIADAAKENINEFCAEVTAIEGGAVAIEGEAK